MTNTLPRWRTAETTDNTVHVYDPRPPDASNRQRHGRCVAYARRRPSDLRWEVRLVGDPPDEASTFDTRAAAVQKLAELTGVAVT